MFQILFFMEGNSIFSKKNAKCTRPICILFNNPVIYGAYRHDQYFHHDISAVDIYEVCHDFLW